LLYLFKHTNRMGLSSMPLDKHNLFYDLRKDATEEQLFLADSIIDYNVVFSNSEAGTGKTTWATAALYYLYETKKIDKIYYIVSPVEEDKMGFRPGTQGEKEADYAHPLHDALAKIGLQPDKALDAKYGCFEMATHVFLRGRNLERVGIILDEAQNYTVSELKKTITRVHDNCHLVVMGHTGQIDLKNKAKSGFAKAIEHFGKLENRVRICPLTKNFRGWISQHADKLDD